MSLLLGLSPILNTSSPPLLPYPPTPHPLSAIPKTTPTENQPTLILLFVLPPESFQMGMAVEPQFHVLAVDDSLIDRKLIEQLLKTSSYQVTTVDSGSKALEFLGLRDNDRIDLGTPSVPHGNQHQEVEVNLIITDYCMPGMTGYDLLKKIKESSSLRNIPVVIMSSENVPSRISRCLEEGAEEFFLKPVRRSDLNKLRPHLMKTKLKEQKPETQDSPENPRVQQEENQIDAQQPTSQPQLDHHHQQQQPQSPQHQLEQQQQQPQPQSPQHQLEKQQQQQQPQPQSPQAASNNKRKAIEQQGIPPETERTRPRYSDIATVV